jgi:cell division protein FtsN
MEEEKKKTKEYYQVNLDTGRIFWIVFVVGIVVIGIFFLGLFFGGDKEKKSIFGFDHTTLLKKEVVEDKQKGLTLPELVDNNLEDESRYIAIEDIGAPVKEVQVEKTEAQPIEVPVTKKETRVEVVKPPKPKTAKPPKPKTVYVARGDYYIQVASFLKEENANNLAAQLREKLYKVVIEKAQVEDKTYYRVRVGPFETESIAKNTMISMKNRYDLKGPFVVKKRS